MWRGWLRRSFQIELFRGQGRAFLFYKEGRFTFNMIKLYSKGGGIGSCLEMEEGCFGFSIKGC